jgi:periplasmic copper chaperone A
VLARRSRRSLPFLLAAALTVSACGGGADGDAVAVDDVRSRMSPMLAGVAAVYLELENTTDTDDALVGASVAAEVADRVELHETYTVDEDLGDGMGDDADGMGDDADGMGDDAGMGGDADGMDGQEMGDGAMMSMREVPEIALPAGATVELAPGGLHLMLIDLVEDLSPGDTFELTLEFEQADSVTVTAEVREDV